MARDKMSAGTTNFNEGKIYLILGSSLTQSGSFDLSQADFTIMGETALYRFSPTISFVGDVDGDGLDDFLIGASEYGVSREGGAYLFLGSSLGTDTDLTVSQADYFFLGESPESRAGISVSSTGDVDGDGLDDILIGAYGSQYHAQGKVYLVYASSLGSSNVIDLSQSDYSMTFEEPRLEA